MSRGPPGGPTGKPLKRGGLSGLEAMKRAVTGGGGGVGRAAGRGVAGVAAGGVRAGGGGVGGYASGEGRVPGPGRSAATVERVAEEIWEAGAWAETAVVDALEAAQVDAHADAVVAEAGSLDVSFNLVG